MDLYADWLNIIKNWLIDEGVNIKGTNDKFVGLSYIERQKKLIPSQPRKVHEHDDFSCPEELLSGLDILKNKLIKGESINYHLSRGVNELGKPDLLLYDWGIHHFHLGKRQESDGFIERSGSLLYAKIDEQDAYFIGVYEHGAWTQIEMMEILHRKFPESIKHRKLTATSSSNLTAEDIKNLRKKHAKSIITVDGCCYSPEGLSYTSSGNSVRSLREYDMRKDYLKRLEKALMSEEFILSFLEEYDVEESNLQFELIEENNEIFISEANTNWKKVLE